MRTFKDWIIASKPWSWTAALMPLFAIAAYHLWNMPDGAAYDWWALLLSVLMLVALQAASNLISDYYDFTRGVDPKGCESGALSLLSGTFQPKEILLYGFGWLIAGAVFGLCILLRCGWEPAWLGAVGLVMAAGYPWFKSHAMGDLDVLFGFCLLPAVGLSYALTGAYHWETMLVALPVGLITMGILHANNTRDMLNDRSAGLKTVCNIIGERASQWVYVGMMVMPYVLVGVYMLMGLVPVASLVVLLTVPMAWTRGAQMMKDCPLGPKSLSMLDQKTAQMQMAFGIIYSIGFIAAWILL